MCDRTFGFIDLCGEGSRHLDHISLEDSLPPGTHLRAAGYSVHSTRATRGLRVHKLAMIWLHARAHTERERENLYVLLCMYVCHYIDQVK